MAEQTPDEVRVTVLDEPAIARPETQSSPLGDVENQNYGHIEGDIADVGSPLLSPGHGGANMGGSTGATELENLALTEIQSLVWTKEPGNEVFREALFASREVIMRQQSSSMRDEIYQLVGFYSVFLGVLLTAVAQFNYLPCHNWWTVFVLSLLASLVTVGGVLQKFRSVIFLEKITTLERCSRRYCVVRSH